MKIDKKLQLTKFGFDILKAEYEVLVSVKRPKLVDRLSNARGEGDLAENSDYNNAKDELEFLDGRIAELKSVLENALIITIVKNGKINFGTKVTVAVNGKKEDYTIVGEWEANPTKRKISHNSPLGLALLGKSIGEKIEIEAPAGKILYEILAID